MMNRLRTPPLATWCSDASPLLIVRVEESYVAKASRKSGTSSVTYFLLLLLLLLSHQIQQRRMSPSLYPEPEAGPSRPTYTQTQTQNGTTQTQIQRLKKKQRMSLEKTFAQPDVKEKQRIGQSLREMAIQVNGVPRAGIGPRRQEGS